MSWRRLAVVLLALYPPGFRRRFRAEWIEAAQWYRREAGASWRGHAFQAVLFVFDTLKNLPGAYVSMGTSWGGWGERGWWGRDVRYALTALGRNRVFALAAVASVALGVAVNTAVFSVVDGVLLRPLPYERADRLAIVWNEFPGAGMARLPVSGPELQMIREEPGLFEDVAGIWASSATLSGQDGTTLQVSLGVVTPNLFTLLGVVPARGRSWLHEDDEDGGPGGVVVSWELWQSRLGGDPAVLDHPIDLDGEPARVLGVLPRGFTLHMPEDGAVPARIDVYVALPWDLSGLRPAQHYLRVVARLAPSTAWSEVSAGVARASDRARATYPQLEGTGDRFSALPLQADAVREARPILVALMVAVGLFLLLSATNVASLILARTLSRGPELAIRASLGASRPSLARLVVVESLLVALIGAGSGILLGRIGATTLWALRPAGLSRADALPLDPRVLAFSLGLSLVVAVAFAGIALVAVRAFRPAHGIRRARGGAGVAGRRLRETLTIVEVAVGMVLVVGSALMVRSFASLGRESIGFVPGNALTFRVPLPLQRFPEDQERERLASEIERRISEVNGVVAVGATSHLPFNDWANWSEAAAPEGTPEEERSEYYADHRAVTPGYLDAMGVELASGRLFDSRDGGGGAHVVVVDETMAARVAPNGDAVGKVIVSSRYTGGRFVPTPATIVGVVRDLRDRSPSRPSSGQVFWPFGQSPRWELTFFVRTDGDPLALADPILEAVTATSPDVVPARVAPMADYVRVATGLTRFLALVGSVFSTLAIVLAAIGLYGVVAFVTVQRTREIAVRVAVGASRGSVLRDVVSHGMRLALLGVVLGSAGTLATSRFLEGLVYGVRPTDPSTLGLVAAALVGVLALASLIPARRAVSVDPVTVLRESG